MGALRDADQPQLIVDLWEKYEHHGGESSVVVAPLFFSFSLSFSFNFFFFFIFSFFFIFIFIIMAFSLLRLSCFITLFWLVFCYYHYYFSVAFFTIYLVLSPPFLPHTPFQCKRRASSSPLDSTAISSGRSCSWASTTGPSHSTMT